MKVLLWSAYLSVVSLCCLLLQLRSLVQSSTRSAAQHQQQHKHLSRCNQCHLKRLPGLWWKISLSRNTDLENHGPTSILCYDPLPIESTRYIFYLQPDAEVGGYHVHEAETWEESPLVDVHLNTNVTQLQKYCHCTFSFRNTKYIWKNTKTICRLDLKQKMLL